jgi:hypothetical protein
VAPRVKERALDTVMSHVEHAIGLLTHSIA